MAEKPKSNKRPARTPCVTAVSGHDFPSCFHSDLDADDDGNGDNDCPDIPDPPRAS
jgi:hypothetical protein